LVILDAHAIIHRAYHALPDFATSGGEPTGALYGLSTMLMKIIGELSPDYIVAAYDLPKPTYRHEAYDGYKGTRAKTDDALVSQLVRSREVFEAMNIPMYDKEGFEADDVIGTIVSEITNSKSQITNNKGVEIIIASGDMDTLQLVDGKKVQVYTLKKGIQDTILYDETAVEKRFGFGPKFLPDFKGLRGDPSDNIIGIAGIGEKTATTLIKEFGSVEDIYKTLKKSKDKFEKAGIKPRIIKLLEDGEEEAFFSKMLASIRRDVPIDFVLPKKTWRENVSLETITGLFSKLEFRTLGARARELLSKKTGEDTTMKNPVVEPVAQEVPDDQYKEASIGLWLLKSNITNPKIEDILNYAGTKDFNTAKEKIMRDIKENKLSLVFEEIEKPLIPVVTKMNNRGVTVDKSYLDKLSKEYHKKLSSLEGDIWNETGEEFNINSPKQLGEILFVKMGLKAKNQKKTSTGALSTRESELEKLREEHKIIDKILEYREFQKLLSTYIDTIPDMVDNDGRLRANFLQAGTTTGRMSSENPNLQNIPIKTETGRKIRGAFVATEGFSLVAFDYSQIELRIAAFLSGDEKLCSVFRKGEDVHTSVASEVFGVSKEDVTKEMRRKAKVINFGILYGMGINALKANLGTSRAEAQEFYNEYFKKFSTLAEYLEGTKEFARQNGFTETYFGRKRYFPDLNSRLPYIVASAERMAINAPIQGTEADIIKKAMVAIDSELSKKDVEDAHLLLQVHDELVFEIKKEKIDEIAPLISSIMTSVIEPDKICDVPIVVDINVGDRWGEMEKSV